MEQHLKVELLLATCQPPTPTHDFQVHLLTDILEPYALPDFSSNYTQKFDFSIVAHFCQKLKKICSESSSLFISFITFYLYL